MMNINLPKDNEIKELLFEDLTNNSISEINEEEFNRVMIDNDEEEFCGESKLLVGRTTNTSKPNPEGNNSEGLAADYIRHKGLDREGKDIVQQFFE